MKEKKADLIWLARMLWIVPQWPVNAQKEQAKSILKCSPRCDACTKLVMRGKPAFCPKWKKEKRVVKMPQGRCH
ncbi:MAG: hypothetical protein KAV87_06445 [Desulfobacteraceae bacterium]|nr:hypothetical protein [Desulfobacteraceae bacterium]